MPAQNADSEEEPYRPTFASEVEMIPDWVGRSNTYLNDTSNGSLQARFYTLGLNNPLNMVAACNLLDDINKGKVVANTKNTAVKLVKTKKAADREQTIESANAHQNARLPHPTRVNTPENRLTLLIAIFAFEIVMMREQAHSDEFENVKGQHSFDLGNVICIIFEAVLDHRDGAHEGYFVHKFSIGLASNGPSPVSLSPSISAMLPFTPKVALFLKEKPNKIRLARRYLEKSRLFSQINSLDLDSRAVRDAAAKLLSTSKDEVCKVVVDLAAQAATFLNKSTELSRDKDQVAQSGNLTTRLIRLAAVLVSDRKRKFPVEFAGRGTTPFNMFIVIALIFEIFTAHGDEGSYIYRELAAAARAAKRAATSNGATTTKSAASSQSTATPKSKTAITSKTAATSHSAANSKSESIATSKSASTSKSAATSKRRVAQTNTDSTKGDSSFNIDHEDQPAKKRRKQANKKHISSILEQTQEPVENDTFGAQGKHLEEVDSDPESSLFIPQTGDSGLPVAASPDNFWEEYREALDEGQTEKYSIFSKSSEGPAPQSAPQTQRAGTIIKPKPNATVLQDEAPDSDSIVSRQDNDHNAHRKPHNATSPNATGAAQEHHKKSSTTSMGGDSPPRGKGKPRRRQARR